MRSSRGRRLSHLSLGAHGESDADISAPNEAGALTLSLRLDRASEEEMQSNMALFTELTISLKQMRK